MTTEIGISKYKNINGVTCYMNSILAILQQLPLFSDYIVSGKFKDLLSDDNHVNKISFQLHKLFRISMSMDSANLTPSTLRKVCSDKDEIWGENQQQDSAEFLQFMITKIEEELGRTVDFLPGSKINDEYLTSDISNSFELIQAMSSYQSFIKKEFSPIKSLFTGLEKTKTKCKVCQNMKNNFQTFSIWQLPIPQAKPNKVTELEDCMDKWFEVEKLDDHNRLCCDFCGVKSNASKTFSIFIPPKILVIQLKRFKRDMYGQVSRKINDHIDYPIYDLDISKYISDSSPNKHKCKYNLLGINIHQELGSYANINLGHYVSILKNRYDNNWYLFNDDNKPMKVDKVEQLVNSKTYLLFYYRTN